MQTVKSEAGGRYFEGGENRIFVSNLKKMTEGSLSAIFTNLFRNENLSWPEFNKEIVKATLAIVIVNGGLALAYKG